MVVFRAESNSVGSELGAWVDKMELTDELLLATFAGIRSRTIYRLSKSHCFNKNVLDRIVGTPTDPKQDGAARDQETVHHAEMD